jgi:anti-anti-sigma factor
VLNGLVRECTVRADGTVDLSIGGEIDTATRDQFAQTIRDAVLGAQKVVNLDLSDVSFMSSDGINVLIQMRKWARQEEVALRIIRSSRVVDRVIQIMGLRDYFD